MKSYHSTVVVLVAAHVIIGLSGCRQRGQGASGLRDDLSNLNLEAWPAARPLVVDENQQIANSTYYFNPSVDGGLTKVQIGKVGLTQISVSANSVQSRPFTDVDNDGNVDYPRLLVYKEQSGPTDLVPVINGQGEVKPSWTYPNGASFDLNAFDTERGEIYHLAFLHHPAVKFDNNVAMQMSVYHTPIDAIDTPEHEISVTGDPRNNMSYSGTLSIARRDIKILFKLDHNHTGNPMNVQFSSGFYRNDGNCDNRVSLAFIYDDGNGQGRVDLAQDANPCQSFDGSGGFQMQAGGKYFVEMVVKNQNGPVGTNNFSMYAYENGRFGNARPMSIKDFPNNGVINVSNNGNYLDQNGISVDEMGWKGKFSGVQGRTFVDANVYASFFDPLNSSTTTRRPAMLVITNSANQDKVEVPLGNGSNPSGDALFEVLDNVEYTIRVVMSYGPDVTGDISLNIRKSEAILPPRTQAVQRLEATLKDVPAADQAQNFYFPNADDYKAFIESEIQQGRFHFVEHMPPNNTIPPNDPSGKYPNEDLNASATTGRPLMRELVFYAMKDIQFNWQKAQDIDDIGNNNGAELRYVDRGTISACLGNTAEHWSDLILHFYCQFGQMRGCYTGYLLDKAPQLANIQDPAERVKAAGILRVEAFDVCIASGDALGNMDARTAMNNGKLSEYEWRWVKDRKFKYPDPVNGPNEASMAAVFQYVMTAPTFRWHMQHEQDVLNAFYRVDDPSDAASCSSTRMPRGVEDTQANFCAGNKKHASLLAPAAR